MALTPEQMGFQRRQQFQSQEREGQFADRGATTRGEQVIRGLGYSYRGAENLLPFYIGLDKGVDWKTATVGGESVRGVLVRVALEDLAIMPRFRNNDRTLEWSVQGGVAGLLNDARVAMDEAYRFAGTGADVIRQRVSGTLTSDARYQALVDKRAEIQKEISGEVHEYYDQKAKAMVRDVITPPITDPGILDTKRQELELVELDIADANVDATAKNEAMDHVVRTSVLAGESIANLRDKTNIAETRRRIRSKREVIMQVEEAVNGVGVSARFLGDLMGMQTDIGGIVKLFTGPDAKIPTHLMRFLSMSDQLNKANTIAFREWLKLCYPQVVGGQVVHDSAIHAADASVNFSLSAARYTPEQRDKFFKAWEEAVITQLETDPNVVDGLKLAEDAVSFSTFLAEVFTLGGTGYVRERGTGKKIAPGTLIQGTTVAVNGDSGTGSMYDYGGNDMVDKVHQLHDRKQGEAEKGRISPRPGVIKGLSQELLYSIFQYTEAKQGGVSLNMNVMDAMINNPTYTMRDFIDNLNSGGHFTYMLFAFRACQISDKLDALVSGRISPLKELGGGPEKLVEDMIDSLQGLAKAFQTIPLAENASDAWKLFNDAAPGAGDVKKRKTMEINRNVVNMLSDFYRGATAGTHNAGGYMDNKAWRGIIDELPVKIYERFVVYTNLLSPQQFWVALEMAKEGSFGGVLTEEMVYGTSPEARAMQEVLLQKPGESAESLINVVNDAGYEGYENNLVARLKGLKNVINTSADKASGKKQLVGATLVDRANNERVAKGKAPLIIAQKKI